MSENPLKDIEGKLEKQPIYVWIGALGAGAVVFWYVIKQRATKSALNTSAQSGMNASGTTGAADTNATLNGYDVSSMAGLPYGSLDGYGATSGYPVDNYPVPTSGTPSPTSSPSGQQEGLVRPRFNSNTTQAYDAKFPQGVPIHQSPDASSPVVSFASYASQVAIQGPPVSGTNNFGKGSSVGSGLWFPVNGGYISGYDLVGFFTLPTASGTAMNTGSGGYDGFASFLNSGRNTIGGHADMYGLSSE